MDRAASASASPSPGRALSPRRSGLSTRGLAGQAPVSAGRALDAVRRDAAATDKLARHPRTMAAMQLIDGAPVYSATDLVGFVACAHRFELERAALAGLVAKPIRSDPTIELIQERGYEHERRYLDDLRAAGRSVVEIARDGSGSGTREGLREAAALTLEAMRARADVVYQATFFDEAWRGHADFLLRVDHAPGEPASALGDWHYEVADTKLARHVKAGAVLQICSYVEQLERVQGRRPEHLHVALGGSARETVTLRVDDYMAYFRRVKADFLAAAGARGAAYPPDATYPEPVEHCDVCRWWADCADRRRGDDDLSLVAGISARQRRALKELPANQPPGPIATRRGLAGLVLPLGPGYGGGSAASLERVREQARIQVQGDERGELLWELLEPERSRDPETGAQRLVADRGFLVLPEPSPNDLFLDLEGDPFAFDDGIDYLFGILDPAHPEADPRWAAAPGADRVPAFRAFWSLDEDGTRHPRGGEGRLRANRRLPDLPARRGPDAPRLPLRGLREDRPGPSRAAPRNPRGPGRPAPEGPGPGGPLPGRPAGDPGQRRELLDQAPGAPLRVRARRRPQGRGQQHRRVRGVAGPRGDGGRARGRPDPARDRGLQPRRRRLHLAPARLARGASGRSRRASRRAGPAPGARGCRAGAARAERAPGCGGRCRPGAPGAPAGPRAGRPAGRGSGDLAPRPAPRLASPREQGVLVALLRPVRPDRRGAGRRARADRHGDARGGPGRGRQGRPPRAVRLPAPGPRREGGPPRRRPAGPGGRRDRRGARRGGRDADALPDRRPAEARDADLAHPVRPRADRRDRGLAPAHRPARGGRRDRGRRRLRSAGT